MFFIFFLFKLILYVLSTLVSKSFKFFRIFENMTGNFQLFQFQNCFVYYRVGKYTYGAKVVCFFLPSKIAFKRCGGFLKTGI